MNYRDLIHIRYPDTSFLFLDGFDEAIIGVKFNYGLIPVVVYDEDKCIEILQSQGMSNEEALEYFDFNVRGMYVSDQSPDFINMVIEVY